MKIQQLLMISLIAFFSVSNTNCQDTIKTLFNNTHLKSIGIYLAPEFQYGEIQNANTGFAGISVMVLLNNRLSIGGSMVKNLDNGFSPNSISPLFLSSYWKTVKVEYTVFPASKIHVSIPFDIGIATLNLDSIKQSHKYTNHSFNDNRSNNRNSSISQSDIQFLQLGIFAEANLTKWVKLYMGANYRNGLKIDSTNSLGLLSKSDLNGLSIVCGIKVGLFNRMAPCCHLKKSKSNAESNVLDK